MIVRTGSIYKIENLINGKVYIGQTVLKPELRWSKHLSSIDTYIRYPLYADFKKFGVEHFSFQVIETSIPLNLLDDKEIFYIAKYKSFYLDGGYNLTRGGQRNKYSKLTECQVLNIIYRIRHGEKFKDIASLYGVSYSVVSDINCGDIWYFEIFDYPIRKQSNPKKNYSYSEIYEIREQLMCGCNLSAVAKLHNTSVQTIRRINLGEIYRDESLVYPLYDTKHRPDGHLSDEMILVIIDYLESTNFNYNEIVRDIKSRYDMSIDRHTISGINNGVCYASRLCELGYEYFPIR